MQAGVTGLIKTHAAWRNERRPHVLATVIATEGSTYRKAGAQMLLAADGDYAGLLGGGCLEGDLLEHARSVLDTGQPETVEYDMTDPDEALWGLGLGCGGKTTIFLQPSNTGLLDFITACVTDRKPGVYAVITESNGATPPPGLGAGARSDAFTIFGSLPDDVVRVLKTGIRRLPAETGHCLQAEADGFSVFYALVELPPEFLILGCGPDATPVADFANGLGWRVTLADHRANYAVTGRFPGCAAVHEVEPGGLHRILDPAAFDAVLVMSHNLRVDLEYLRELADSPVPYIGLLGSLSRRERLLEDLGDRAAGLGERFHSPAGLDIAADTPEAIGLSIVAEIQGVLHTSGTLGRRRRPVFEYDDGL